jgi:VWFA-related protein
MGLGGLRCAAAAAALALVVSTHTRAQQPPAASAQPLPQTQAQPPQPPPPQPPTFRTEANLVRVDVTVVDRHGEPATTLTADDFAVAEDGVPQTVQSFKFVSADGRPPYGDEDSLAIRSPEHAAAEAARDEVRVFLIFWDEYHIGRFVEAIRGRTALTAFVSSAFGPTDLVALMDPLLPVDALRFTRDRRELAEKIGKLEGRFGIYTPTRSAAEDNMLGRRDAARVRSEVTISAMKSAVVHLGSLKEGRKSIIFVSEGLTGLGIDQLLLIQELTDAANNSNTAIYTMDPSGLTGNGSADVLRTLPEQTGGEAIVNSNAPEHRLRQVVKDASAFYLLGYSSSRNPQDGKFHKISVKVKRSGLDVRARRGYWAPNLTEMEHARTEAAAAGAIPTDVTSAMAVLSAARADRIVDVWVGAAPGADGQPAVTVAWTPRAPAVRGAASNRTVSVVVKGAGEDRSTDAKFDAGALTFPSPPGAVQLQTTVRDANGNVLDEDRRPFIVPDFSVADIAIGPPVLLRARTVAEARAIAVAPQAVPFAGREFIRTDHLYVRFSVYGAAASEAEVSARLDGKSGATLLELPVVKMAGAETTYQIDVPLASIARGDFLIAVEASHGDERARVLVPLRIVP